MDPKRELMGVNLAVLITELSRYEGAKVDKAYLCGSNLLRLRMRDFDRGRLELLFEVSEIECTRFVAQEYVPGAPGQSPNLAMMLRNRPSRADLMSAEQRELDRTLTFMFGRGDENTKTVVELFEQGNITVFGEAGEVVHSLGIVRLKSWTVAPGLRYGYPVSRFDPLTASRDVLGRNIEQFDINVVRTLIAQSNLGGLYVKRLCIHTGVGRILDIVNTIDDGYDDVHDAIVGLREQVRTGGFDPQSYLDDDGEIVDMTPSSLREYQSAGFDEEAYDTFNDALDEYFFQLDLTANEQETTPGRPDFEEQVAKQQCIIDQQKGAIKGFEQQVQDERERTKLLCTNCDLINDVLSTIHDIRGEGIPWDDVVATLEEDAEQGIPEAEAVANVGSVNGTIAVDLDDTIAILNVSMGVEKNANRLYTGAKHIEEKKGDALTAIKGTRKELVAAKGHHDEQEADGDNKGGNDEDEEPERTDWLALGLMPVKSTEHWLEWFCWFRTSTGYFVVGGRSVDQNEELMRKYMSKYDRFFHMQAHGRPVTLLEATRPSESAQAIGLSEETLREAAQFAVSYSFIRKEGRFADDAYMVEPSQMSKMSESGEYIEKGSFVVRGDHERLKDVPAKVAIGIQCEDETRVIDDPPSIIETRTETTLTLTPGQYAQNNTAKLCYRRFRGRFADRLFVRKIASPDRIQEFPPPDGSNIVDE